MLYHVWWILPLSRIQISSSKNPFLDWELLSYNSKYRRKMANPKLHLQMEIFISIFARVEKRPLSSNSFFLFHYRTNFLNFILQICTFHGIGNYSKAFSCVIFVNRKKWNLKFVQLELNIVITLTFFVFYVSHSWNKLYFYKKIKC